jgi:RNA polymerase sigma-70 factor (ECF subfamily)
MRMVPDDEELLRRLRNDDYDAFEIIINRYRQIVVQCVLEIAGGLEFAEDFAQEAFLKLWEYRKTYEYGGNLGGYLIRTAFNLCVNEIRRTERFARLYPDMVQILEEEVRTPEEEALAHEEERMLTEAIALLPDAEREVLMLHDGSGWAVEAIAVSRGTSVGAVRTCLSRARAGVRSQLGPWWTGEPNDEREEDAKDAKDDGRGNGRANLTDDPGSAASLEGAAPRKRGRRRRVPR